MKKYLFPKYFLAIVAVILIAWPVANVFSAEPTLNPFSKDFKLSICDGPPLPETVAPRPGYVPCDFNGLMKQAQFLINGMVMLGVLAAIASISYGGYLYITGEKGKIDHAKEIFAKTAKGFIMMLVAWFIVYQLLEWLTASSSGARTLLGT